MKKKRRNESQRNNELGETWKHRRIGKIKAKGEVNKKKRSL